MRRRAVVSTVVTLTAGVFSGCSSVVREAVNPTVQLGWFGIHNADTDSSHRFELEVERDGEIVHSSTHTLDAARRFEGGGQHNDGAVADCEWESTPGDYTVRVRVDGTEWVERSVTEFATSRESSCVVADAEYRSTLSIYLKAGCKGDDYDRMCSFTK